MANLYLSNRIAPEAVELDAFVASSEVIEYEGNESVKSALRRALLNGGGSQGEKGDKGDKGDTPMLRIDENGYWVVSYDNGQTWEPLNVKASGEDGEDGEDAPTPIFELRGGHLFVSLDNRGSWVDLGKVTGADGVNGKTVEFIFYRYNDRPLPEDKYPSNDWGYDAPQNGWTDNAQGVTAALKYEYVSMRYVELVNNVLISKGDWSVPSIWAVYSDATISDDDLQQIIDDASAAAIAGASGAINTALGDIDQAKKDLEDANKRLGELADQMKDLEDADNGLGARISEDRDRMTIIEQDCDSIRSTAASGHYLTDASGEFVNEEGHTLVYFYIAGGAEQYYFWENESPFVWYDSEKEEFYRLADGVKDVVDRPENYDYQSCGIDVVLRDENEVEYFAKDDAILVVDAFSDLKQTSDGITAIVADNTDRIAKLELTAENFGVTLESFKEGLSGAITRIGTLEVSATGISERVTSLEENEDNYLLKSAQQDITADAIRGVVTGTDFTNVQAAIQNLQKDLAETTVMDGRYLTREENGVTLYVDENDYVIYAIDWDGDQNEASTEDGEYISDVNCLYKKNNRYYAKVGNQYKDVTSYVASYPIHPLNSEDSNFTDYAVLVVDALSNIRQTVDEIDLSVTNFDADTCAGIVVKATEKESGITLNADKIHLVGDVDATDLTVKNLHAQTIDTSDFRYESTDGDVLLKISPNTYDSISDFTSETIHSKTDHFGTPYGVSQDRYFQRSGGECLTSPFGDQGEAWTRVGRITLTQSSTITINSDAFGVDLTPEYYIRNSVGQQYNLASGVDDGVTNLTVKCRLQLTNSVGTVVWNTPYQYLNINPRNLSIEANSFTQRTTDILPADRYDLEIGMDLIEVEYGNDAPASLNKYSEEDYPYLHITSYFSFEDVSIYATYDEAVQGTSVFGNGMGVIKSPNEYFAVVDNSMEIKSNDHGILITPDSIKAGFGNGYYNLSPLYLAFHWSYSDGIDSAKVLSPYKRTTVTQSKGSDGKLTLSFSPALPTDNYLVQVTPYDLSSSGRKMRVPMIAQGKSASSLSLYFQDRMGQENLDSQCACDVMIYIY